MSQHTEVSEAKKVLEVLELCAHPITINQIETLAGCRDLGEVIQDLVNNGLVIVSTHRIVATSGQTTDEQRYQIGTI